MTQSAQRVRILYMINALKCEVYEVDKNSFTVRLFTRGGKHYDYDPAESLEEAYAIARRVASSEIQMVKEEIRIVKSKMCDACRRADGKPRYFYIGMEDTLRLARKRPDGGWTREEIASVAKDCAIGKLCCDPCGGSGVDSRAEYVSECACKECHGLGYVRCGKCYGSGWLD